MEPPSEVENPRKPDKPTVAELVGMIASVLPVAVATVAATASGGHLHIQPQSWPSTLVRGWVFQASSLLELMSHARGLLVSVHGMPLVFDIRHAQVGQHDSIGTWLES